MKLKIERVGQGMISVAYTGDNGKEISIILSPDQAKQIASLLQMAVRSGRFKFELEE